jgi:hypothetical protein
VAGQGQDEEASKTGIASGQQSKLPELGLKEALDGKAGYAAGMG